MNNDPRIASLHEWNRLTREGAENAIVSSMFEASSEAIGPIEIFVTWLLAGAAIVASFLLGNSGNLVPILGDRGFLWCGLLLGTSCLCGVVAKTYALRAEIGRRIAAAVAQTFAAQLSTYDETAAKIQEAARALDVEVETDIRLGRVVNEFLAPMPFFVKWLVARALKKNAGNPQIGHLPRIKALNRLGLFTFLQSVLFLSFIIVGFASAAI
jgi:hypothetical protein